jgi:hypothetical protein
MTANYFTCLLSCYDAVGHAGTVRKNVGFEVFTAVTKKNAVF